MRLERLREGLKRGAVVISATYLFFTVFPHVESVTHVHADGENAHTHGFLSSHDAALERAAWAALETAAPREATQETGAVPLSLESGTIGLRPGRNHQAHTHFQQDPNLLAAALQAPNPALPEPLRIRQLPPPPDVPDRPALNPSARGPPAPFLSA
jgi:hypothetical protein